ncbi:hypothetical protein M3172_20030 [Mesobacillus subterraneus]|uniref:hypothetical protein n=1 Tax=Mesobacillus subterraneus TaxID=285983 RepID=UPI00203AD0DD|nr:hypothetical protein [Mesobacillus subterraneus]MCM3575495.1 hypothetical protein [Mesobacillus subterraneus]
MNIKERIMKEQQKKFKNLMMCTRDIESIKLEEVYCKDLYTLKVKQLDVNYIEPYMIYAIFVQLLEFNHTYKPMEKILYEIPFKYKNIYGVFSMKKFGLNLGISNVEEDLLKDLFKKLNSASKIAESLLRPLINEAIDNGEITIENQTGLLKQRYLYFRRTVKKIHDEIENNEDYPVGSIAYGLNRKVNLEKEIIFNTQAMLDAYFSFQEHLLILLLPFTKIDYKTEPIPKIINSNWSDKFKKIFELENNRKLLKYYEALKNLKEIRNKHAHGGFEKGNGSLIAHIKGVGAIPVEVPSQPDEVFSFLLIKGVKYKEMCEIIDRFEEFLYQSEWNRAIKIVESIPEIRFDAEYVSELKWAVTSDENLEYFLEKESYIYDREANMDW